jgi:hypothetical protein
VARVLDTLIPLVGLPGRAQDPVGGAQALVRAAAAGADAATVAAQLQAAVADGSLAGTVLTHAGCDGSGRLTPDAATRLAQAAVLIEVAETSPGLRISLTGRPLPTCSERRRACRSPSAQHPAGGTTSTLGWPTAREHGRWTL